jgi:hypothetical protein
MSGLSKNLNTSSLNFINRSSKALDFVLFNLSLCPAFRVLSSGGGDSFFLCLGLGMEEYHYFYYLTL